MCARQGSNLRLPGFMKIEIMAYTTKNGCSTIKLRALVWRLLARPNSDCCQDIRITFF